MTATAPTPGPWEAKGTYVFAGNDCVGVCDTGAGDQATYEANARLMAAAQKLLSALEQWASDHQKYHRLRPATARLMRAALAKTG